MATTAPAPLPTSSEPRAFLFLAHPHRLRPRCLQLGAPSCPAATLPPLRVCYVPEHRSACSPPPAALSGGAPTPRCSLGQVLSEDPVRKGWGPAKDTVTAVVLLPAGSRVPGTVCWTSSQESGSSSQAAAHHWRPQARP